MSDQQRPENDLPRRSSTSEISADQVDAICDRFEAPWQAGQEPRIEEFLLTTGESSIRRQLLVELIKLDLNYRWKRRSGSGSASPEPGETVEYEPAQPQARPRLED